MIKNFKQYTIILGFFLLLNSFQPVEGAVFRGWCMKVVEADTIMVYVNKKLLKIRIAHIDCPESGQPFGIEAQRFVTKLILKKKIQVEIESYTETDQMIGRVVINGEDLSMVLVKAGLAWYFKDHGPDRYLAKAQRKVRRKKVGLWSQKNPVPPWVFRQEMAKPKKDDEE
jgi:endonuclease YncB( thermonuclease family)